MTPQQMLDALAAQGLTMGPAGVPVPLGSQFAPAPADVPPPDAATDPLRAARDAFGGSVGALAKGYVPTARDTGVLQQTVGPAYGVPPGTPIGMVPQAAMFGGGAPAIGPPPTPPKSDMEKRQSESDAMERDGQTPTGTAPTGPAYAGPTYASIPAHDVAMTSPEAAREFGAAQDAAMTANDLQRDASQAAIQAQRDQRQAMADALEADRAKAAQREAQRQSVLRQNEDEQSKTADQIARTQIDPGHLWSTKSAGQKMFGWLAAIVGGYLSGHNGGPNVALQSIDAEIDRDIDAQKANLANARGKLTDLKSVYAQKLARFGDERTADAAAKSDMLSALIAHGDAMATDAQSKKVTADWAAGRAPLLEQKAKLNAFVVNKWQPAQTVQTSAGTGSAGGADKSLDKLFQYRGKTYQAPSPDAAGKMQARIAAASTLSRAGNEIDEIRSDPSWVLQPEKKARLHALGLQMRGAYITANDLSPKLIENDSFVADLGDPTAFFSHSGTLAKQVGSTTQSNVAQAIDEMRPEQVERSHNVDAQGQVKPTASYTGDVGKKTAIPSSFK